MNVLKTLCPFFSKETVKKVKGKIFSRLRRETSSVRIQIFRTAFTFAALLQNPFQGSLIWQKTEDSNSVSPSVYISIFTQITFQIRLDFCEYHDARKCRIDCRCCVARGNAYKDRLTSTSNTGFVHVTWHEGEGGTAPGEWCSTQTIVSRQVELHHRF